MAATREPDYRFVYCNRGPCAGAAGHEGTCAEASGWGPESEAELAAVLASVTGR